MKKEDFPSNGLTNIKTTLEYYCSKANNNFFEREYLLILIKNIEVFISIFSKVEERLNENK